MRGSKCHSDFRNRVIVLYYRISWYSVETRTVTFRFRSAIYKSCLSFHFSNLEFLYIYIFPSETHKFSSNFKCLFLFQRYSCDWIFFLFIYFYLSLFIFYFLFFIYFIYFTLSSFWRKLILWNIWFDETKQIFIIYFQNDKLNEKLFKL